MVFPSKALGFSWRSLSPTVPDCEKFHTFLHPVKAVGWRSAPVDYTRQGCAPQNFIIRVGGGKFHQNSPWWRDGRRLLTVHWWGYTLPDFIRVWSRQPASADHRLGGGMPSETSLVRTVTQRYAIFCKIHKADDISPNFARFLQNRLIKCRNPQLFHFLLAFLKQKPDIKSHVSKSNLNRKSVKKF